MGKQNRKNYVFLRLYLCVRQGNVCGVVSVLVGTKPTFVQICNCGRKAAFRALMAIFLRKHRKRARMACRAKWLWLIALCASAMRRAPSCCCSSALMRLCFLPLSGVRPALAVFTVCPYSENGLPFSCLIVVLWPTKNTPYRAAGGAISVIIEKANKASNLGAWPKNIPMNLQCLRDGRAKCIFIDGFGEHRRDNSRLADDINARDVGFGKLLVDAAVGLGGKG